MQVSFSKCFIFLAQFFQIFHSPCSHDTNHVSKEQINFSTTKDSNLLNLSHKIKPIRLQRPDPTTWVSSVWNLHTWDWTWLEEWKQILLQAEKGNAKMWESKKGEMRDHYKGLWHKTRLQDKFVLDTQKYSLTKRLPHGVPLHKQ